ncbi:MAG TPA: alpha/beta hydrolase [Alphaproteobacteria bacterium]|nr:alpha/beta hydrolase [Alphaproteobacteria bacterium]
MERLHRISGGGGVELSVAEAGDAGAPAILLIHGVAQSRLSWHRQMTGSLASGFRVVAFDLRGHGASARPVEDAAYDDGRPWAEDVAAVIAALELQRPVLAGWSYGGIVVGDYLARFGNHGIGGLCLVGAAVKAGTQDSGDLFGPALPAHAPGMLSGDIAKSIRATRAFIRACTAQPLDAEDYETILAAAMMTPPTVRRAVLKRRVDHDAALRAASVPTLVVQGMADQVVLPAMAEHVRTLVPSARLATYEGVGHMPFIEAQARFEADLGAFTREVAERPAGG